MIDFPGIEASSKSVSVIVFYVGNRYLSIGKLAEMSRKENLGVIKRTRANKGIIRQNAEGERRLGTGARRAPGHGIWGNATTNKMRRVYTDAPFATAVSAYRSRKSLLTSPRCFAIIWHKA
jgi:hypothetical protein